MYLVTSSKRLTQITVALIGCLAVVAGFAIYQTFQRNSAQPQALMERIQQVSTQSAGLNVQDLNIDAISGDITQLIRESIADQLSLTDYPNPGDGAQSLVDQATAFLAEEDEVIEWLEQYLSALSLPGDSTQLIDIGDDTRVIEGPDHCLVISRDKQGWRLVSLLGCQLLDGV